MASSISFWRVLISVHSPFWRVFEKYGFPHCFNSNSTVKQVLQWNKNIFYQIFVYNTLFTVQHLTYVQHLLNPLKYGLFTQYLPWHSRKYCPKMVNQSGSLPWVFFCTLPALTLHKMARNHITWKIADLHEKYLNIKA